MAGDRNGAEAAAETGTGVGIVAGVSLLALGDDYCCLVMAVTLVVTALLLLLLLLVLTPEPHQWSLNLQCQLTAAGPADHVSADA